MYVHSWLDCKGHSGRIEFPHQSPIGKLANPAALSKDDWYLDVLCQSCNQVRRYWGSDLRHSVESTANPFEPSGYRVYSIQFACGQENCETPVVIYTFSTAASASHVKVALELTSWKFDSEVRCRRGHVPEVPVGDSIRVRRAEVRTP